ncbi:MAG: hypothetical protein QXO15_11320 [Nitrososphaerota archaeon]
MKKRKKRLLVTISLIIIFIGIILASCSSIYTIKEEDSLEENGVKYSISENITNGTKITRYFKLGDKMTVRFTHSLKPPYLDFYLINFTIISPDAESTIFWFELEPYFNPYSGQTLLVVTNLTIGKSSDNLDASLTTQSNFMGKACKEGNYTLIFTSPYPFRVLSYMAFVKIVTTKEYPYTTALPSGIILICAGTSGTIWTMLKSGKKIKVRIRS